MEMKRWYAANNRMQQHLTTVAVTCKNTERRHYNSLSAGIAKTNVAKVERKRKSNTANEYI